jgi:hypothetical protein
MAVTSRQVDVLSDAAGHATPVFCGYDLPFRQLVGVEIGDAVSGRTGFTKNATHRRNARI